MEEYKAATTKLIDNLTKKIEAMEVVNIRLGEQYNMLKGQIETSHTRLKNIDSKQTSKGKYKSKQDKHTKYYFLI